MSGKCCSSKDDSVVVCCSDLGTPANLNELVKGLNKLFQCPPEQRDKKVIRAYMESYKSNQKDWEKYAKFSTERYTRNLVDKGNGHFNLIVLCWGESQGSAIHSHANSDCYMKILAGEVKETQYEWPNESAGDQRMVQKCENVFKKDEVAYICDEIGLHRVENPSHTEKTVTLHLYSPPFDMCEKFDEQTGHKQNAPMTFDTEYGQAKKAVQ